MNENIGWLAGENGTLLKTEDGGESWNEIELNDDWHIRMIDFITESVGWASGSNDSSQVIWKTSNGGNTWQAQLLNVEFKTIYVVDESNVYAIGNDKIFKTSNGTNWIDVSPNLSDRNYHSLYFQDSQTGVVVGNYDDGTADRGVILRTTNGGTTWNENVVSDFKEITDLQFLDSNTGYFRACSDTTHFICKTEDMLLSWEVKTEYPYNIFSYHSLDDENEFAIMEDSSSSTVIKKSTDGGLSWMDMQSFNENLFKIYFINSNTGLVLGDYGGGNTVLYKSNDEGFTWVNKRINYAFKMAYFFDKDEGFIGGGEIIGTRHGFTIGLLLSTNDGGNILNDAFVPEEMINSCVFVDENFGLFLLFFRGSTAHSWRSSVYKATRNGNNWDFVHLTHVGDFFRGNDICFFDNSVSWIVGYSGYPIVGLGAAIMGSFDNGNSWDLVWQIPDSNGYDSELYSVCSTSSESWAVGEGGMIVKYTPQSGWVLRPSVTDLPLNKVYFNNESNGWITGGYLNDRHFQHILLRTTDAGETWERNHTLPYLINDIFFVDSTLGWAVGNDGFDKGVILKTTNGGEDWEVEVDNLIGPLSSISIKDNYAWAVGEYGLILRTTNAGRVWVEDENNISLNEFRLEQNYPNPFNPNTKIKYSIPYQSKVILKIYDVIGNEIETLINEEKLMGNYEVEFNSGGLATGVYFYQLKAGLFIQTKKMVIIK